MEAILEKYGWVAMLIYVIVKDILPWAMNRYFPERMKQEQAKRNAAALVLKNEIDEKEFQRNMQQRSIVAMEKVGEAMTILNERLDKLTDLTSQHNQFTIDAVTSMRESVAKMKRDSNPKIKAVKK